MAELLLDRRVAVVTGAGRGFGCQRARSLAGHSTRAAFTDLRAATTRVFVALSHAFGAIVRIHVGLPT
jgi:NAD(P)-dependent dehydrogenase (short-subunit alcohol dehydrogenase family)